MTLCYTALIPGNVNSAASSIKTLDDTDGVPSFERDGYTYIVALTSAEGEGSPEDPLVPEMPSQKVVMTSAEGVTYSCAIPSQHPTDTSTHPDVRRVVMVCLRRMVCSKQKAVLMTRIHLITWLP